jgi:hypothetical protein
MRRRRPERRRSRCRGSARSRISRPGEEGSWILGLVGGGSPRGGGRLAGEEPEAGPAPRGSSRLGKRQRLVRRRGAGRRWATKVVEEAAAGRMKRRHRRGGVIAMIAGWKDAQYC